MFNSIEKFEENGCTTKHCTAIFSNKRNTPYYFLRVIIV